MTLMTAFQVHYEELVLSDLSGLRAFDRSRIMDEAEALLANRPNVAEGHKKILKLKDGSTIWQLRVGEFRVLYDVDINASMVKVRRVLSKGRRTTKEMMEP